MKKIPIKEITELYKKKFQNPEYLCESDPQLNYILNFIPRNKKIKILDAGCGDGKYSSFLISKGYQNIISIDLFDQSPEPNINYLKASVEKLPFDKNYFDFIFSNSVIFYVNPPFKALIELKRVLKKNGIIIFSAHTKWSLFTAYRILKRNIFKTKDTIHLKGINFYSANYYSYQIKKIGLKILLRDGFKLSFIFYPLFLRIRKYIYKFLKIKLPKLKPYINNKSFISFLKSEISYHSIFAAKK